MWAPSLTYLPCASPPAPWQELHLVQWSWQFPEAIFPILISSLDLGFLPFPPPPPGCLPRIFTRLLALIKVWLSLGPQILLGIKGATLCIPYTPNNREQERGGDIGPPWPLSPQYSSILADCLHLFIYLRHPSRLSSALQLIVSVICWVLATLYPKPWLVILISANQVSLMYVSIIHLIPF